MVWFCPKLFSTCCQVLLIVGHSWMKFKIRTSSHSCFCYPDNVSFLLLIKAAVHIVTTPNSEGVDPVYSLKRKVLSLHKILTTWKNLKQNLCAKVPPVLFLAPAGPVRNIKSCSIPPLAFNSATKSSILDLSEPDNSWPKHAPNVEVQSCPSQISPNKKVHEIIP